MLEKETAAKLSDSWIQVCFLEITSSSKSSPMLNKPFNLRVWNRGDGRMTILHNDDGIKSTIMSHTHGPMHYKKAIIYSCC